MTEYGAVILAAGAGSRLAKGCPPGPWLPGAGGVAKALLAVRGGRTFLATILASAGEVGHGQAIVVVGPPHGDAVALHAHELGARTVVNAHPERGMASSIALGFAAIAETSCEAAWLWPVDHPDVAVATLRRGRCMRAIAVIRR
jgi:CTP:molybdopterin cytidylyltransferase MocA